MQNGGSNGHLNKHISPIGAWALAFGCCVGWGAFVMPGTSFLPVAGPVGTLIGLGIGALLMMVLAANYQYMMNRYAGTGGAYEYAGKTIGSDHGFLAGWFMILAYIVVFWGNATALPMIARNLLGGVFQFGFHYTLFGYEVYCGEILISLFAMLIVALICLRPRLAIKLQVFLALILAGGIAACSAIIFLKSADLSSLTPAFAPDINPVYGVFSIISLAPWAFVGFETISHSSEEFSFDSKKSMGIMVSALLFAFASYGLLTLISIASLSEGQTDWVKYLEQLSSFTGIAAYPTFSTAKDIIGKPGVIALGITALAAIFTGLIGFATASSRLLYSIAQDDLLPAALKHVNSNGVPSYAVIAVLVSSIPVLFLGRTAINWLVDVTTICIIIAYAYVSVAALNTSLKEKNTKAKVFAIIGLVISCVLAVVFLIPNLLLIRTMGAESYLLITIWSILGLLWFRYMFKKESTKLKSPSALVWGAFLVLIIYTSLIWVTQTAAEIEIKTSEDITNYYSQEYTELSDEDIAISGSYVQNELQSSNKVLRRSSMIQIGFIIAAMFIIFSIFNIMQKRARTMEIEKARAEESSRAKSTFLSNMSHDIRTPMNAIIGMTDIALKNIDDKERVEDCLTKVSVSGKHLLGIINDILDISKIESGKMTLTPEKMSLKQAAETMRDIVMPQAAAKNQSFEIICGDLICENVYCDSVRLNQLLLNLLSNAVKYTAANGSIRLSIQQEASEKGDEYVATHFEVKDNGMGMSKEYQKKLFTSFEREDNLRVHKTQGTGLGLAITKYIVDAMEGSIEVVSEPGAGTTFHVKTDLKRAEKDAPTAQSAEQNMPGTESGETSGKAEEKPQEADLNGKLFLLAEDNDINAEIAEMILEELGASVERAEDGQIAADMFAKSEPCYYAAVLMDLRMPNMNGIEATKAIRGMQREDAAAIPIIAMTADAFADDAEKCINAGMNAHLAKPIDVEKLKATLLQYL